MATRRPGTGLDRAREITATRTAEPVRAVFFDVDGVLLDSLPQHLKICADEAAAFGLNIEIPKPDAFRHMVESGTKVSPMFEFFSAVGFPPAYAKRAVADYERSFMERYRPALFRGVEAAIVALRQHGLRLGLVTSNTKENVLPALGPAIQYFEQNCFFFLDTFPGPMSKALCLKEGAQRLHLKPAQCVYVGDQPADAKAAREAGCRFIGVTYGWGLSDTPTGSNTAASIEEVTSMLVAEGASRQER